MARPSTWRSLFPAPPAPLRVPGRGTGIGTARGRCRPSPARTSRRPPRLSGTGCGRRGRPARALPARRRPRRPRPPLSSSAPYGTWTWNWTWIFADGTVLAFNQTAGLRVRVGLELDVGLEHADPDVGSPDRDRDLHGRRRDDDRRHRRPRVRPGARHRRRDADELGQLRGDRDRRARHALADDGHPDRRPDRRQPVLDGRPAHRQLADRARALRGCAVRRLEHEPRLGRPGRVGAPENERRRDDDRGRDRPGQPGHRPGADRQRHDRPGRGRPAVDEQHAGRDLRRPVGAAERAQHQQGRGAERRSTRRSTRCSSRTRRRRRRPPRSTRTSRSGSASSRPAAPRRPARPPTRRSSHVNTQDGFSASQVAQTRTTNLNDLDVPPASQATNPSVGQSNTASVDTTAGDKSVIDGWIHQAQGGVATFEEASAQQEGVVSQSNTASAPATQSDLLNHATWNGVEPPADRRRPDDGTPKDGGPTDGGPTDRRPDRRRPHDRRPDDRRPHDRSAGHRQRRPPATRPGFTSTSTTSTTSIGSRTAATGPGSRNGSARDQVVVTTQNDRHGKQTGTLTPPRGPSWALAQNPSENNNDGSNAPGPNPGAPPPVAPPAPTPPAPSAAGSTPNQTKVVSGPPRAKQRGHLGPPPPPGSEDWSGFGATSPAPPLSGRRQRTGRPCARPLRACHPGSRGTATVHPDPWAIGDLCRAIRVAWIARPRWVSTPSGVLGTGR